jgi:hypothetical protein
MKNKIRTCTATHASTPPLAGDRAHHGAAASPINYITEEAKSYINRNCASTRTSYAACVRLWGEQFAALRSPSCQAGTLLGCMRRAH